MWMIQNCKNGVSSHEIGPAIGVTQKSAWFMLHRIRLALQEGSVAKLTGEVEVDETFIGGLSRNMHKEKRECRIKGTGGKDKTAVMGILERGGEVRATVIQNRKRRTLHGLVKANVSAGSAIYSDALASYDGLEKEYMHQVVDHAVEYVRGRVHTNGLENFWSLVKRGLKGTYVSVEPFHLFRYLDEQAFRYNNRKTDDAARFDIGVRRISGKRLTYKQLTGKTPETETNS
jgi:transposase-like protein